MENQKLREYIEQQRELTTSQKITIRELERNVTELTRAVATQVGQRAAVLHAAGAACTATVQGWVVVPRTWQLPPGLTQVGLTSPTALRPMHACTA